MKAILISIKPEWCAKIMNGEKTIEVRKTTPKCDLPIDVYIYCSKRHRGWKNTLARLKNNKFINFDKPDEIMPVLYDIEQTGFYGKVVAKFTLNKVEEIYPFSHKPTLYAPIDHFYHLNMSSAEHLKNKSCVDYFELNGYLKGKIGFAWHIDNLEIFDKPKELSEFTNGKYIFGKNYKLELYKLTKAPQSWCYVEDPK